MLRLCSRLVATESLCGTRRFFMRATVPALAPPTVTYKLADIGEGIKEVEVLSWRVAEGDKVKKFDALCEVQSDKATVEITSPYLGTITKLYAKVGQMAQVGEPLVDFEVAGIGAPTPTPAKQPAATAPSSVPATASAPAAAATAATLASSSSSSSSSSGYDKRAIATPAVRRISREYNVPLNQVQGSGKEGRVLKGDILAFVEGRKSGASSATASTAASSASTAAPSPAPSVSAGLATADTVLPVRGLMRTMVKTMTAANAVPHFGYCEEYTFDALIALRKQVNEVAAKQGIKLTYLPFIMKACSLALKQYPILNSHVNADCTEVLLKGSHNIGVAMDTPQGLLVPVVKNCESKSVLEIGAELKRLQTIGADGKLGADDLSGGTFTLSNIGAIGGTYAKPVVFVPQVCIGAVGRLQRVPRFDADDNVIPTSIVQMSWSADHRVIDGATMAHFSNLLKQYLENPVTMLAALR